MDNLKAHKVEGIEEILEAVGARVVSLSPYSPEFNLIEHLWWPLKAFIRRFVPKRVEAITKLLALGVQLCSSRDVQVGNCETTLPTAVTVPVSSAICRIRYIENWSLWLDLQIVFKTVQVILRKSGAY